MSDTDPKDPQDPNNQQTPPQDGTPENLPPKKEGEEGSAHEEGDHVDPPTPEDPPIDPPQDPPQDPPAPAAPSVDYKEKFSHSARRNQIVESQLAELRNTIADITKQEIPTDEEMLLLDKDWEYRSDFEKNQAIKTIVLEKRLNLVTNTLGNITRETEKSTQLQSFIENEPKLKGKEDEFYKFATAKKNQGADVDVLLKAFLFEVKDESPDPQDPPPQTPPAPSPAPSLNRSTPTGGNPPVDPKDKKLSPEDIKIIRTTDHKRYNELVRTGQI
jgi:hypothetical protein